MDTDERSSLRGWVLVAAQLVLLGVLLVEAVRAPRPRGVRALLASTSALAGLGVIAGGSRVLGTQLRAHPAPSDEAVLRTDGLYRYLRHPIYSGLLLCALGLATASRGARARLAFGGLVALLNGKARFEERLLRERFPDYAAYEAVTPRFVPRLDALVYRDAARQGAGRGDGGAG